MSLQYTYCPTCGTRRVAHGYRCSVCDRLVRRVSTHTRPPATIAPIKIIVATPQRQPIAA